MTRRRAVIALMSLSLIAAFGAYIGCCIHLKHGVIGNGYGDMYDHYYDRQRLLGLAEYGPDTPVVTAPTMPYALILDQVFYAGWLSPRNAELYISFMHVFALVITAFVIYDFLKSRLNHYKAVIISLVPMVHFSWLYSIWWGNEGGVICLLLIDAILLLERHPYISGIIISLCMTKPQIAGLFCLVILLRGGYRTIFTAAVIDMAAYVLVSVISGSSMIELLRLSISAGTENTQNYLGLFTFLVPIGINRDVVLGLNMISGLAYMFLLYAYLKRNIRSDNLLAYAVYLPVCAASVIWTYKMGPDYLILSYAAMFGVMLCLNDEADMKDFKASFVCTGYLLMGRIFVYAGEVFISKGILGKAIYKGLDGLMIMVSVMTLCRLCVKYQKAPL